MNGEALLNIYNITEGDSTNQSKKSYPNWEIDFLKNVDGIQQESFLFLQNPDNQKKHNINLNANNEDEWLDNVLDKDKIPKFVSRSDVVNKMLEGEKKAKELCDYLATAPFIGKVRRCEICDSVEECVQESDILTSLTPSRKPFIMTDWLKPGMHINAIGADAEGKQEFEDNVANVCSTFVVDDRVQAFHSGESQHSENKDPMKDLFDIVENKNSRGVNGATGARLEAENNGISFFDSTGLAIEDVALANYIYNIIK